MPTVQSMSVALLAGLNDSLNLGGLTLFLLTILFFYFRRGFSQRQLHALYFFYGIVLTNILLMRGAFPWVEESYFIQGIDGAYALVAGTAALVALVALRDWVAWTFHSDVQRLRLDWGMRLEGVGMGRQEKLKASSIRDFGVSFLVGFFLGFLSSAWPFHADMNIVLYESTLPGHQIAASVQFFFYGLGYVFPSIVLLLMVECFCKASWWGLSRWLSLKMLVTAAVFGGYAVMFIRALFQPVNPGIF